MRFPWYKLDPNERIAAPILLKELGVLGALRVGRRIRRRMKRGEPFAEMPPPQGDDERLSREQIGPAVLLYQELQRVTSQAESMRITEEVVVEAGILFLRDTLGPLRRADLEQLDEAGREQFAKERGARFFNATMRWDEIGDDRVRFTVTACRFPRLCADCGVPELAPVFCRADARYFGTVEPDVTLTRPHTIAEGATECPFALQWAQRR